MGEARHRRERLGDLYGTPEGSNRRPDVICNVMTRTPTTAEDVLAQAQQAARHGCDYCAIAEHNLPPEEIARLQQMVLPVEVLLGPAGVACL